MARRTESVYDTDGIVVGINALPVSESSGTKAKNPKDCVAFKMPLADQSAETTVREVLWSPSAQGYLVPRIRFDPVTIGAAKIEFCTGHNARMIVTGGVGPGAKIVIRRSGDVIPKMDAVLKAVTPSLPPVGTWEWIGSATEAVHIRLLDGGDAMISAKIHHFLKTLDIPGSGPACAAALVAAGIHGPKSILDTSAAKLSEILGPKTGASLYTNLRSALAKTDEMTLMIASSTMPRGVGETKLKAIFAVEADPDRWTGALKPAGWTAESFSAFLKVFPTYKEWRKQIPLELKTNQTKPVSVTGETICMTGFRDAAMEENATAKGHAFVPSVTGKTTILLVPDGPVKESEKVKAARAKAIRILSRSEFMDLYLK
jgi:NAD-dependent DNA ligase